MPLTAGRCHFHLKDDYDMDLNPIFSILIFFLHWYKHGAGGFSYKSMQTLREPSPQAISVVNSVKLETRKY